MTKELERSDRAWEKKKKKKKTESDWKTYETDRKWQRPTRETGSDDNTDKTARKWRQCQQNRQEVTETDKADRKWRKDWQNRQEVTEDWQNRQEVTGRPAEQTWSDGGLTGSERVLTEAEEERIHSHGVDAEKHAGQEVGPQRQYLQ